MRVTVPPLAEVPSVKVLLLPVLKSSTPAELRVPDVESALVVATVKLLNVEGPDNVRVPAVVFETLAIPVVVKEREAVAVFVALPEPIVPDPVIRATDEPLMVPVPVKLLAPAVVSELVPVAEKAPFTLIPALVANAILPVTEEVFNPMDAPLVFVTVAFPLTVDRVRLLVETVIAPMLLAPSPVVCKSTFWAVTVVPAN